MTYTDPWLTIHCGDSLAVLRSLPAESVQCVVTSPPYWGLRDYGVSGQLGLEATPEAYVAGMVAVFAEVRRVLRRDGVCWVNLGDSYASHDPGGYREGEFLNPDGRPPAKGQARNRAGNYRPGGCKPKDLVGIPWMLAFALRADGWYLRSDVIWSKPNPMPESVTDRPTKAHEYLFLLTRSARYFYDAEAIAEPVTLTTLDRLGQPTLLQQAGSDRVPGKTNGPMKAVGPRFGGSKYGDSDAEMDRTKSGNVYTGESGRRNARTVWSIATEPYAKSHFATFPQKLVEPCIKAGTSERGACPECGAPWVRETSGGGGTYDERKALGYDQPANMKLGVHPGSHRGIHPPGFTHNLTPVTRETTGWRPGCAHDLAPTPCVVLDPFLGSGTVALVAERLGRRTVGIELNPEYVQQALARVAAGRCEGTGAPIDLPLPAPDGSLWDQAS